MNKINLTLLSGFALLLVLAGCSGESLPANVTANQANTAETDNQNPAPAESNNQTQGKAAEPNQQKEQGQKLQEKHQKIKLYYADDQVLDLIEIEQEVKWPEGSEPYKAAFEALAATDDSKRVSLWEGQNLNSIEFSEGRLTIDFKSPYTSQGSSAERLKLLSLLQTMFQFAEVKEIQLMMDGEKVESLDGHMVILEPFTRETMAGL